MSRRMRERAYTGERTVRSSIPQERGWRPHSFGGLERVSRAQILLTRRLEWLLPGAAGKGPLSEKVQDRLRQMFDEEVRLVVDYLHVISPRQLRKYVGDPTFMAVLAPQPHKTRAFMEVELSLAHAAIDLLLGGAGETVALRPLTDIEEGVMSYVIIEMLKALSPELDPGLPKLRLEGLARGLDEIIPLVGDEPHLAVVQMKAVVGQHSGYLRLLIPSSVLGLVNPPADGGAQKARRAANLSAHLARLAGVKSFLRAEIGQVKVSSGDLAGLREGDVVLVDQLGVRPDRGEGGTARLKVGRGRVGWAEAEVVLEQGRYQAKLTAFQLGEPNREEPEVASNPAPPPPEGGSQINASLDSRSEELEEKTQNRTGGELLNDIPLQLTIELGRVSVTADEVLALQVGQVLDLNRVPGEPVELSVNGKVVARGEVVEVEGHLGVRVLSLAG